MNNNMSDFTKVETFKMGKWIGFIGRKRSPRSYKKNTEKLTELIKNTSWPEKDENQLPLEDSDIYVFVDNDMKPCLEIRIKYDSSNSGICAIRGTEPDEHIDNGYEKVILSFLKGNINKIPNFEDIMGSLQWNDRLIYYINKIESGNFSKEDVPDFIHNYFLLNSKYMYNTMLTPRFENRNRKRLTQLLPNIKKQVAEYYGCNIDEILFDNLIMRKLNIKNGETYTIPYKVIFGYLDCSFSNPECEIDMGSLERIAGDANFSFSKVYSLKGVKEIAGSVKLSDSLVSDLGELSVVKGSVYLNKSSFLKSLQKLTEVGGNVELYDSKVEDIGLLKYVGGNFVPNIYIVDLRELTEIGGNASLNCATQLKSLGENLKKIGGDVSFSSSTKDLGVLEYVGGKFDGTYTEFRSMKHVKYVGGTLYLWQSKVDDLSELETVDGDVYLEKIASFGNLKNVKGQLNCYDQQTIQEYNSRLGIIQENSDTNNINR